MLFIAVALLLNVVAVASAKSAYPAMVRAAMKKPVLKLSPRTFGEWIETAPRNYSVVVELTSLGASFPCPDCRETHSEFELAAESYLASMDGVDSALFRKKPLFFATMDYSEAMLEHFRKFSPKSLPFFAIVKAGKVSQLTLGRGSTSPSTRSADDVAQFVRNQLKINFTIARPIWPMVVKSALSVIVLYYLVTVVLPSLYRNPFNPKIAFALSMAVFFLSMSGLVFNLIRKPAFTGVTRDGRVEYVQAGSRSQYVAEGLIVASLIVSAVLCHIGVNEVTASRLPASLTRVVFYALMVAYIYAINTIWAIFTKKYGFYPYSVQQQWMVPSALHL